MTLRLLEQTVRLRVLFISIVAAAFVYAFAPLAVLALAGSHADTGWTRGLAFLIPAALMAWIGALVAHGWVRYERLDQVQMHESGPAASPLPPDVEQARGSLAALGFRAIGEYDVRLPWQPWRHDWAMASDDGTIVATLETGRRPVLSTRWPDGAFVVTLAAGGTPIVRTRNAWQRSGPRDLSGSLAQHRADVARFGEGRGAPRRILSIGDVVAHDPGSQANSRAALRAMLLAPRTTLAVLCLVTMAIAVAALIATA